MSASRALRGRGKRHHSHLAGAIQQVQLFGSLASWPPHACELTAGCVVLPGLAKWVFLRPLPSFLSMACQSSRDRDGGFEHLPNNQGRQSYQRGTDKSTSRFVHCRQHGFGLRPIRSKLESTRGFKCSDSELNSSCCIMGCIKSTHLLLPKR